MCWVGPVLVKEDSACVLAVQDSGLDWQQQDILAKSNYKTAPSLWCLVAGADTTCLFAFSLTSAHFSPQSFVPFITSVTNTDLLQ
jgi:hypothetical protein